MFMDCPIVARDADSQLIYVSCDFWLLRETQQAGLPPLLQNDFLMQISPTITRPVVIGGRMVRLDGVRVREQDITDADLAIGFQYETIEKTNPQVIAEVERVILRYWGRAKRNGYTGDQRQFRSLSDADPDGVLGKTLAFRGLHEYPEL